MRIELARFCFGAFESIVLLDRIRPAYRDFQVGSIDCMVKLEEGAVMGRDHHHVLV